MTNLQKAAQIIIEGGVVIYPTETFYALGCSALDSKACARVFECKGRDQVKPLPVLIGNPEQLEFLTSWSMTDLGSLTRKFWPGSLSVLLPAGAALPREVQNEQGLISLRWTPHPVAQRLSLQAQCPVVATSANFSRQYPAAKPGDLDPGLLQLADLFLDAEPWPAGGLPSTLVQFVEPGCLKVLRSGAVSGSQLREAGFKLV